MTRRGNMANFTQRQQADIERDRALELIRLHPGITMQGIADKLGRSKSSTYAYVATLIGSGKVQPVESRYDVGKRGTVLSYHLAEDGEFDPESLKPQKCDVVKQVTVSAVDKAGDHPPMDNITALLFGRNKEAA